MATENKEAVFLKQPPKIMGRDVTNPIVNLASGNREEVLNNLMLHTASMQTDLRTIRNDQISTNKALLKEIQQLNKNLKLQIKGEKQEREDAKKRDQRLSNRLEKQLRSKKGVSNPFNNILNNSTATKSLIDTVGKGLLAALFPGLVRGGLTATLGALMLKPLKGALGLLGKAIVGIARFLGVGAFGKWLYKKTGLQFLNILFKRTIPRNITKFFSPLTKGFSSFLKKGGLFSAIGSLFGWAGKSLGKGLGKVGGLFGNLFKTGGKNIFAAGKNGVAKGALSPLGRILASVVGEEKLVAMMTGVKGVKNGGLLGKAGNFLSNIFAKKGATTALATIGTKGLGKAGAKTAGKVGAKLGLKRIPLLGALMGAGFAIDRARNGDTVGAGLEALSGVSSLLDFVAPGVGTAISLGLDGYIIKRDIDRAQGKKGLVDKFFDNRKQSVTKNLLPALGILGGPGGILAGLAVDTWLTHRANNGKTDPTDIFFEKFKTGFDTLWRWIQDKFKDFGDWIGTIWPFSMLKGKDKDNSKPSKPSKTPKPQPITLDGVTYNNVDEAIKAGHYMSKPTDKPAEKLMSTMADKPKEAKTQQSKPDKKLMSTWADKPKDIDTSTSKKSSATLKKMAANQLALSDVGSRFIQNMEGTGGYKVYRDNDGALTAGFGHHLTAQEKQKYGYIGAKVDPKDVQKWWATDKVKYENMVRNAFKDTQVTQGQFDALVDLAYNTGNMSRKAKHGLFKAVESGDNNAFVRSYLQYDKGEVRDPRTGKKTKQTIKSLTKRRIAGAEQLLGQEEIPFSQKTAIAVGSAMDVANESLKDIAINFFESLQEKTKDNPFLNAVVNKIGELGQGLGADLEDLKPRYSSSKPDFWSEFRGVDMNNAIRTETHSTAVEADEQSQLMGLSAMGSKLGTKPVAPDKYNATVQTVLPGVDTNQLIWYQMLCQQQ